MSPMKYESLLNSQVMRQTTIIINSIQTENEKMSNSMVKSINEIKAGILVTNSAGEAFQKISSTIGKVDEDINEIYSEISDINEAVQEIKESGDRIVDITKSSSDKTQDVAASIEEMSAVCKRFFPPRVYLRTWLSNSNS